MKRLKEQVDLDNQWLSPPQKKKKNTEPVHCPKLQFASRNAVLEGLTNNTVVFVAKSAATAVPRCPGIQHHF